MLKTPLAAALWALLLVHAAPGADLAPRHDTRYQVIDEQWASLDGSRRFRIPTLRALDVRSGGPQMIVAVYEQGPDGEVAVASEEGEDVRVERIFDLDRDGKPELVIRIGNGGRCLGCSWLAVYGARRGRIVKLAPDATLHDLADVDGDGRFEGLAIAVALTGSAGLPPNDTPRVERVYSLGPRGYVPDDRRFARYHWRRLMAARRALEEDPEGRSGYKQVKLCIELYFEHEILGLKKDGLEIARWFLRQLELRSDRMTAVAAERARLALESRVHSN